MSEITLTEVGPGNLEECGIGCLADRKNPGWTAKAEWLEKRFTEGLRFLLFRDGDGRALAFLEFVPGENAWRPVDAAGWLFVHCLWVYPRGQKVGGLGRRLIEATVERARDSGALGVAAMVSEGPWMAGPGVFSRCGFLPVDRADRFELVVRRLADGPDPSFRDIRGNAEKLSGLHVVYADQCPMLTKSVTDLTEMAAEHGLTLHVTRLETPAEAQAAPSAYGVYTLVWNGRVLSDRYVSKGRFRNLLKREILPG